MQQVEIYTDGACSGNPGPGGFGTILIFEEHEKEISGAYENTTNNRMEIMAVIKGLELLKRPCQITLYSDSQYLINAMTKGWVDKWRANNWKRNKTEYAKNVDLWEKILELVSPHEVKWIWVKGHANNERNNRCDQLAVNAIKTKPHLPDNSN